MILAGLFFSETSFVFYFSGVNCLLQIHLNLQITQSGSFDRKGDDLFAGRFFGQAVEKLISRTAANDKELPVLFPGDGFQFFDRLPVGFGQGSACAAEIIIAVCEIQPSEE